MYQCISVSSYFEDILKIPQYTDNFLKNVSLLPWCEILYRYIPNHSK